MPTLVEILTSFGINPLDDLAIEQALDHPECNFELYQHYVSEMPYGTAKARTGDPNEWMAERMVKDLA